MHYQKTFDKMAVSKQIVVILAPVEKSSFANMTSDARIFIAYYVIDYRYLYLFGARVEKIAYLPCAILFRNSIFT